MDALTLSKVVGLAIVDAVNPCAIAVLALILMAIMSYGNNRKKVLISGLSFTLAVFIGYILYGIILIKLFKIVQIITNIRLTLYKILGLIAFLIGILQFKDVVWYKPGGLLTEMPLKWRPKAKKIISKATGPKSAFFVGIFVTLFLLPCTMGPYIVMTGVASLYSFIKVIPWLLLYNIIFVSPMIIITFIVYAGLSKISDIKDRIDKNIRILHLIESLILILIGISMFIGWV